jgi:hypothetical protein
MSARVKEYKIRDLSLPKVFYGHAGGGRIALAAQDGQTVNHVDADALGLGYLNGLAAKSGKAGDPKMVGAQVLFATVQGWKLDGSDGGKFKD